MQFLSIGTAETERAPGTIFTIQQLVRLLQFLIIFIGCSAVGSAPVLNHIPVASLSSITGGDGAHGLSGRVHLPDDGSTLLGEILRHHTLVLNTPENDARRIAALLDPTAQQTLEVLTESGCIIPYMCRELTPEQHALLIQQLLVIEIMWLMCLTEGIKTCLTHHLDTGGNLLVREGMTLTEEVLVIAGSVDENRTAIEIESAVFLIHLD